MSISKTRTHSPYLQQQRAVDAIFSTVLQAKGRSIPPDLFFFFLSVCADLFRLRYRVPIVKHMSSDHLKVKPEFEGSSGK